MGQRSGEECSEGLNWFLIQTQIAYPRSSDFRHTETRTHSERGKEGFEGSAHVD